MTIFEPSVCQNTRKKSNKDTQNFVIYEYFSVGQRNWATFILWLELLPVELRNVIGQFAADFLVVWAGKLELVIEIFGIIKCAKTLLLVFCKVVYVKAQQMDMKPMINMTGKVNDKLQKRKVESSVQNELINNLFTLFVLFIRENICLRVFRPDLAPSSLDLY